VTATAPPPSEQAEPERGSEDGRCPRCSTPLAGGQDWCLNCGAAATTRIAPTPNWRIPVAAVATVLVLALAGVGAGFVTLSGDTELVASPAPEAPAPADPDPAPPEPQEPVDPNQPPPPGVDPANPDAGPGPTDEGEPVPEDEPLPPPDEGESAPADDGDFPSWPSGTRAYTVVLFSGRSADEAKDRARVLRDQGIEVGILESSDYGSLRPGYFVVFSGEYETSAEAADEAQNLRSDVSDAYPRLVDAR
jgi:hypothetical protein